MFPKSNPILTEIQDELAEIGEMKAVKFVWTPGHARISGNKKADEGAKEVLRQCLPPQSTVMAEQNSTQKIFSNKLGKNPRAL
jgi:ribonuclease HI